MAKSRLEMRRMAEAAEKQKKATGAADGKKTKKRKAATKRKTVTRKTKVRAQQRKRIVWCVFNGSMKEEGRFPYNQKAAAEAKLELLRSKSKKLYFLQPVKEIIGDSVPASETLPADEELEETPDAVEEEDEDADEEAEVMEDEDEEAAEELEEDDED